MKQFTLVWDSGAARGLRTAVSALTALMAAACGAPDPTSSFDGEEPIGTETQALCMRGEVSLTRFPLNGTNGTTYMINNYVDRDPAQGNLAIRDYTGAVGALARTYNGHGGIDVDISSFREMDSGAAGIYAAAPGLVVDTRNDVFDRMQDINGPGYGNYVFIRHENGYLVKYGHMRKGSVLVSRNQIVQAGTKLGTVGSSGSSTQPHLHFEVNDCAGNVVDTNVSPTMWTHPPTYNPPSGVMDVMMRFGSAPTTPMVKDPQKNPTHLPLNSTLGIGMSLAIRNGDTLRVRVTPPGGPAITRDATFSNSGRFSHVYAPDGLAFPGGLEFQVGSVMGYLTVEVFLNNQLKVSRSIFITNQVERHEVRQSDVAGLVSDFQIANYRTSWIDGYEATGGPYFNLLFDAANPGQQVRTNLTSDEYQNLFNTLLPQGYRPAQIESYGANGQVRYAAIFYTNTGPNWTAYHGVSEADHNSRFASLSSQGFRPVNISAVNTGSGRNFAAFWDQAGVGTFTASQGVSEAQYQTDFNTNVAAGRTLQYLNAFQEGGAPKLIAIFNSVGIGAWSASHAITGTQFGDMWFQQLTNGLFARAVTGYNNSGPSRFATFFSQFPQP